MKASYSILAMAIKEVATEDRPRFWLGLACVLIADRLPEIIQAVRWW